MLFRDDISSKFKSYGTEMPKGFKKGAGSISQEKAEEMMKRMRERTASRMPTGQKREKWKSERADQTKAEREREWGPDGAQRGGQTSQQGSPFNSSAFDTFSNAYQTQARNKGDNDSSPQFQKVKSNQSISKVHLKSFYLQHFYLLCVLICSTYMVYFSHFSYFRAGKNNSLKS